MLVNIPSDGDFPNLRLSTETMLTKIPLDIARILDNALTGKEISIPEGSRLFEAEGPALSALMMTADEIRGSVNGDQVTYVINRNINFRSF